MAQRVFLIRHGKTSGNAEKRYIGTTDEPITKEGMDEIKKIKYPCADMIFSSPLKRAVQTAEIIWPGQKAIVIDELRETDFGRFEGKNYKELSKDPEYQAWIDSGGTMSFPGGESPEQVKERALLSLKKVLESGNDATNIAIVTHGGIIMAILQHYFGGNIYDYHVENGKGYFFEISSDGLFYGLCNRLYLG